MSQITQVVISGPIGCGKSTLLHALETKFQGNPLVSFLREPVEEWMDPEFPILLYFYENPSRWAFTFQQVVLRSLQQQMAKAKGRVIVTERSVLDGLHIFLEFQCRKGAISEGEYQLHKYFCLQGEKHPMVQCLLVCSSKECHHRVQCRKGIEEGFGEYMSDIHEMYQQFPHDILLPNETREDFQHSVERVEEVIRNLLSK